MNAQTQTWIALAIVGLTLAVFAWRLFRKKASGGSCCGGRCGCAKPKSSR